MTEKTTNLTLRIDYCTDCVGAFDPLKVAQRFSQEFPDAMIDWTDRQAAELERILEYAQTIAEPQRTTMERQARRKAMENGPAFSFEIPCEGDIIRGRIRRYDVSIDIPEGVPEIIRIRLESLLRGLKLGEAKFA